MLNKMFQPIDEVSEIILLSIPSSVKYYPTPTPRVPIYIINVLIHHPDLQEPTICFCKTIQGCPTRGR